MLWGERTSCLAFISFSLASTSSMPCPMHGKSMDDVEVREKLMKAHQHMPEPHTVHLVNHIKK